jgi:cysteine desulfurase/selenocysteine lyase
VLGTVNPVAEICHLAHDAGVKVVVDAAQHVPHATTDVNQWGADWIAFSGHKMLGPSAIGVLYGRRELLEAMPPFLGGGGMIDRVTTSGFTAGELPGKFEAGTPPIVPAIGLSAAIDYLKQFDMQQVFRHEQQLAASAMNAMRTIDGLTVIGPESSMRAGIVSFSVEGVSSQDLAILLDQAGIAVRAGHHCTMPLHNWLGLRNSCRVSFYLYNLQSEVDFLVETLRKVISRLR